MTKRARWPIAYASAILASGCGDKADAPGDAAADTAPADASPDAAPVAVTIVGYPYNAPIMGDLGWVAAQDGDGPFVALAGDGSGVYQFAPAGDRFAVAWACITDEDGIIIPEVNVRRLVRGERSQLPISCHAQPPLHVVSGTVAGLATGERSTVAVGASFASFVASGYSVVAFEGTHDVAVTAGPGGVASRIVLRRDLDVTGPTTVDVDTSGATALVTAPATVDGAPGRAIAYFELGRGGEILLSSADGTWSAVPAAALAGDEVHRIFAEHQEAGASKLSELWKRAPGPVDLVLPPPTSVTVTVDAVAASLPYRATFPAVADAVLYRQRIFQGDGLVWRLETTAGWLGAATAVTLSTEFPDLSAAVGWQSSWMPRAMTPTFLIHDVIATAAPARALQLVFPAYDGQPLPSGMDGFAMTTSQAIVSVPEL